MFTVAWQLVGDVLFPLLDQNKLYTTKWLDYQDFKIVVNYLNTANTTRLSEEQLVWVNIGRYLGPFSGPRYLTDESTIRHIHNF